jgi:O-antigen biosynthesis protein
LSERPPGFWSKRFHEIFWLALAADPVRTLAGFYWFITRRRVRGWSILLIAATNGKNSYWHWTRTGEKHAFESFRRGHACRASAPIVALLLNDGTSDEASVVATLHSLRAAFGRSMPIYSTLPTVGGCIPLSTEATKGVASALSFLTEMDAAAWLLPVLAGDQFSPLLGEILERVAADDVHVPLIYWDEDRVEAGVRADPWVKPDWDQLLFGRLGGLSGSSLLAPSSVQSLSTSIDVLPVDGSGLHRILFALALSASRSPVHIPLILTHRAKKHALSEDLPFTGLRSSTGSWPSVSILVPTRDRADLLEACLLGIERTSYPGRLELIVIDNGSSEPAALDVLERLERDPRATILRDSGPFNFSRLNNSAVHVARGEFLCFLNNDVEPLHEEWLTTMMSYATLHDAGAVGAQLLYPSGRIQHAGVAIGLGGAAGHVQKGVDPSDKRFRTWHQVSREVSAVTAAAMVVSKRRFHEVGGFDEEAFPVAFNDVDLCLRLKEQGLRNIYVAEARLQHRESESRGDDRTPVQIERFSLELKRLQERWHTLGLRDPHHSRLFSSLIERCVLAP